MNDFYPYTDQEHVADVFLNEYLDGYLSAADQAQVEQHISVCSACAARLNQMEELFVDLQDLSDMPLQHDLRAGVLAAIEPSLQMSGFMRWGTFVQFVIALIILFSVLPKHLQQWLTLMPGLIKFPDGAGLFSRIWQPVVWMGQLKFSLPDWQLSSMRFDLHIDVMNSVNWVVFTVVFVLLFVMNGFMLRQIVRNNS